MARQRSEPARRDRDARAFATVRAAERHIKTLERKEPGRIFHVLRHPKQRNAVAIGIMAGGVLLMGYVQ